MQGVHGTLPRFYNNHAAQFQRENAPLQPRLQSLALRGVSRSRICLPWGLLIVGSARSRCLCVVQTDHRAFPSEVLNIKPAVVGQDLGELPEDTFRERARRSEKPDRDGGAALSQNRLHAATQG